ncbi:MAG: hypothetical protein RMJ19_11480 [Gemmatales bacterium]|nr:hypothetical protein [Gemmatales bacterium]MCS7161083.1 hypothetical protein [Gemmatales bacterium]MDW8176286.1 hypothetical protein [Gemmatales bacterium]MDW8224237.1 hypothetical protein [Gemmatales bacterium]
MSAKIRLHLEPLEDRCVPDGNVTVFTDGLNNLIIQGDGANNTIVIEQLGSTEALQVSGRNATLINGGEESLTAYIAAEPRGSIRINMNAGNDTVIIRNINQTVSQLFGDVTVNFGRGGASLWVNEIQNFIGQFRVLAGDGSFFTRWSNFSIAGPVEINAGSTPRAIVQMQIGDAPYLGQFSSLTLQTGRGHDSITLRGRFLANVVPPRVQPLTVGDKLLVDSGAGNDTIRMEYLEVLGSTSLRTGIGRDTLNILESDFTGTFLSQLEAGNDTVNIQGGNFQRGIDLLSGGLVPDQDNISITGISLNGNLKIITGDGNDTVLLAGSQIAGLPGTTQGQLLIQTGQGQDHVELINASIARDMTINLGAGDDSINFSFVNVGGKGNINGGQGTNILMRIGLRAPLGLTIVNFP